MSIEDKEIYTKIYNEAVLVNNTVQDCLLGEISYLENDCGLIGRKKLRIDILLNGNLEKAKKEMKNRLQHFINMHKNAIKDLELTEKEKNKDRIEYTLEGTEPLLKIPVEDENDEYD